ncbi:hypothetical protein FOA43_001534 [Brettanomyces nanus]|uniref:protein-serine/threonine phosphatase n=1 Tax=Eeniella nana TaxID=13502 RepID=A0A875RNV9_EENNA|nr:uncharacterized protein FOA43_001534 [Brettanomyces nanus]QPG74210.1 hypothetical protein FOA43_001534 [Brettanomyces nanus]
MGQILSQPITEKSSEEGGDKFLAYGLSCMQGWRISMEDSHSTILNMKSVETDAAAAADGAMGQEEDIAKQIAYFGVFDGHGGEKVAQFTGRSIPRILKLTKAFGNKDYIKMFKDGYLATDVAILNDDELSKDPSGCAATSVIITKNEIICGNAGDSRTVMSISGKCKPLSFDHKPTNEGEKARIVAAGGYVDLGRVNGNLALSRGIGDFEFKNAADLPPEEQAVTAFPDVLVHDATSEDEFIILACDGIWDCLTSQQAIDFVRRGIKLKQSLTEICETMMDTCLAPTSGGSGIGCDNMSVCIVALLKGDSLERWYDKIAAKLTDEDLSQLPTPDNLSLDLYKVDLKTKQQQQNTKSEEAAAAAASRNSSVTDYDDEEDSVLKTGATGGAPNLIQQLLAASNISTNNDIIYLDSSASSILQSLGVMEEDEADADGDKKMEEITDDDNDKSNDDDEPSEKPE